MSMDYHDRYINHISEPSVNWHSNLNNYKLLSPLLGFEPSPSQTEFMKQIKQSPLECFVFSLCPFRTMEIITGRLTLSPTHPLSHPQNRRFDTKNTQIFSFSYCSFVVQRFNKMTDCGEGSTQNGFFSTRKESE